MSQGKYFSSENLEYKTRFKTDGLLNLSLRNHGEFKARPDAAAKVRAPRHVKLVTKNVIFYLFCPEFFKK